MRVLVAAAVKDLRRWRQDPGSLLLWLGLPLLVGGLVTSLMDGGGGARPTGVLLVADHDETLVSQAVSVGLDSGLGELLEVEAVDEAVGRSRLDEGAASGLLIIPAGFGRAVLRDEPTTLELVTNPAQSILPRVIEEGLGVLLDATFYLRAVMGDEVDRVAGWVDDDAEVGSAEVAALAVAVQARIDEASGYLVPAAWTIEIVEPEPAGDLASLALLFLPGIVLMAAMLAASTLSADLWREQEAGTLRRLSSVPGGPIWAFGGKALAAAGLIGAVSSVPLVLGFVYHQLPWTQLAPAVVWMTLSGLALFVWFAVLQMSASSRRIAIVLSNILLFPLLMLGGSFFPFAALPGWIAALGRITPNGFVADRLTTILLAPDPFAPSAGSWVIVCLLGASGLGLASWRFTRRFARL